jgi:hypothetical protein
MAHAHAANKGAIGLDMSDDKGGKEMIDAPMLKQARDPMCLFIRSPNFHCVGGEDDSYGTDCRPSNPDPVLNPLSMARRFIRADAPHVFENCG